MWRNPPSIFGDNIGGLVGDTVREIAIDGLAQNIQRSPVLTGRYRNNHTVGIGSPSDSNRSADGSGSASRAEQAKLASLPDFPVVYLSNGLPYAQAIEDGISTVKAPSGVFRPTFTFLSESCLLYTSPSPRDS